MRIPDSIASIEMRIKEIETRIDSISPKQEFVNVLKDSVKKVDENRETDIDRIIRDASKKYGVDERLVNLVANVESEKNSYAVSPKGAMGVMQLMPGTAKIFGVKNPFNPNENVDAGVKFLKELLKKYNGDTEKALAAYNAGEGNVAKYNGIPPFKETQNYVKKIMEKYNNSSVSKDYIDPEIGE